MSLPDGWELRKVERDPVWHLVMPDGATVRTTEGVPAEYPTAEDAEFVAATWDLQRAPTWDELQAMSDDDLRARMRFER